MIKIDPIFQRGRLLWQPEYWQRRTSDSRLCVSWGGSNVASCLCHWRHVRTWRHQNASIFWVVFTTIKSQFSAIKIQVGVYCDNQNTSNTDGGNGFDTYFDALKWVIFDWSKNAFSRRVLCLFCVAFWGYILMCQNVSKPLPPSIITYQRMYQR